MPTNANESEEWLRSGDARKILRVSTCELMHLRDAGEIRFRKSGNSYLYSATDCARKRTLGFLGACSTESDDDQNPVPSANKTTVVNVPADTREAT